MARGAEKLMVECVWSDVEPFRIYKIPSGFKDKVLMVYEDPFESSVQLVTKEEYETKVELAFLA
jgi:hypothetical protein